MSLGTLLRSAYGLVPTPLRRRLDNTASVHRAKEFARSWLMRGEEKYDKAFYETVDREMQRSAGPMAEAIVRDISPRSVIDVGCGTGALLAALRGLAVNEVRGLEYSALATRYCSERGIPVRRYDLTSDEALDWPRAELVISTEVGEHLPAKYAGRYMQLLSDLADRFVLFSAATPGQGGAGHVNEQPHEYWIALFATHGFELNRARSDQWRAEWRAADVAYWYSANAMLFVRREDHTLR